MLVVKLLKIMLSFFQALKMLYTKIDQMELKLKSVVILFIIYIYQGIKKATF